MEHDEKKASEDRATDERDEMDDLDVTQQQAEDVKGGRRAKWGKKDE
jgi:hypothetical protein